MNGCDWNKKRFSVYVKREPEEMKCQKCGEEVSSVIYVYNGTRLCKTCFADIADKE